MPPKTAQKQQHPVLILTQSGDVNPAKIGAAGPLTLAAIQSHLKKKKGIECIATYKAKPLFLSLFGATEGDDENQNQHQLPPPYDTTPFYGDIILVASKTEKSFEAPVPFKPEEYEEFYTKMFDGGYDSEDEDAPEGEEGEGDAELDAEPEEDVEEGKEFEEEEEDDEEEEEEEEAAGADDDEAVVPAPKAKAAPKKKKAATKANNTLTGTGTAYPDAPILSEEEQLQEEEAATAGPPEIQNRQQVIKALTTLFEAHLDEPTIQTLERAIYNGAIRQAKLRHVARSWTYPLFTHLYKMHALHISSNFHPESYVQNRDLFDQFQKGDLALESIAAMNTYELYPSRWRELFEQRQIREKKQLEGNRDRATDQFTCTRCWKRECTYYEMQTRSADEPMTIFITCLNCGKKWRQ